MAPLYPGVRVSPQPPVKVRLRVLPALQPLEIEMRNTGSVIQWRRGTDGAWIDLFSTADFVPQPSDLLAALLTIDGAGSGLDADLLDGQHASAFAAVAHTHGWADIVSGKPTTLSGYGILDAQPLDADLTAIAALGTTAFGRSFLELANAAAGRTLLGLVPGTDVQAYDAELAAIAGLVSAADRLAYFTGSGTAALATFTAAGRALVDDADAAAQRTTLGLVIGTDVQAYSVKTAAIASLTWAANKGLYFTSASAVATYDLSSYGRTLANLADAAALTAQVNAFVGDSGSGGTKGAVPAPAAGDAAAGKFLHADGTFKVPAGGSSSGDVASAADLTALRAIVTSTSTTAILKDGNRGGVFVWNASDLSGTILGSNIASSAVNSTTETITSNTHKLITGDPVMVTAAVNGLSLNTIYYAIRVDANNFRLATSYANAFAGTAFNLTATSAVTVRRHLDPLSGIYVTPTSALNGSAGAWVRQFKGDVNVRWFGAAGDGSADDSQAIQAGINYTQTLKQKGALFIPAQNAGQQYNITKTIRIVSPIRIVGETIQTTIYAASGFATSQEMINVDGQMNANLEFVSIETLTIRSNTTNRAIGILFDDVAYIRMKDVVLFDCYDGMYFTGDRSFSNYFENVQVWPKASRYGAVFTSFTGGGHHHFNSCTLAGAQGFYLENNSALSGLKFTACSFEQCTDYALTFLGSVYGCNIDACYFEKNGSNYDIRISPASGQEVVGLNITGCFFETDGAAYAIQFGGAGRINGWSVRGNYARDYTTSLVRYNLDPPGGFIEANFITAISAVTSNGPATAVTVANNRNNSGNVS